MWKIVFACTVFVSFFVSNIFALEGSELRQHEHMHNIVWGSDVENNDSVSKEIRQDDAYQRICELYDEHMFIASPLYENNNNFYITIVFGLLTDFWGRPIYDHAALLCEYYDDENKKISANMYHLTMRDDWITDELVYNLGYSYRGYKIEEQPKEKIVELMMCHPKYKSKYVRYHPYKTFRIAKTEKTIAVIDKLKELSQQKYYAYSLYGVRSASNKVLKGKHNCISFITDILWQFGVFQDSYTLNDVLGYSNAYPLEVLSPYAWLHGLTRRVIRIPETLKHLIDNPEMIRNECEFKVHPAATMENHRPIRHGNAYALVNEILRGNTAKAMLINNGLIDLDTQIGDELQNLKEPGETKEKKSNDGGKPSVSKINDGSSYAKNPGNTYSFYGVTCF
ncbi:MAG: hypothetical protein V4544_01990 [Pseudomonadota bacterium]